MPEVTRNECGGYRPNRNENLEKEMKRVTRMYLHMMPTCSSKFDRKGVMDANFFICEPVDMLTKDYYTLINLSESRFSRIVQCPPPRLRITREKDQLIKRRKRCCLQGY